MATEVIALLRNLMQAKSTWSTIVKDVLAEGLNDLVSVGPVLDENFSGDESHWFITAQQILAIICTLGGFNETVRPGCSAFVSK